MEVCKMEISETICSFDSNSMSLYYMLYSHAVQKFNVEVLKSVGIMKHWSMLR